VKLWCVLTGTKSSMHLEEVAFDGDEGAIPLAHGKSLRWIEVHNVRSLCVEEEKKAGEGGFYTRVSGLFVGLAKRMV